MSAVHTRDRGGSTGSDDAPSGPLRPTLHRSHRRRSGACRWPRGVRTGPVMLNFALVLGALVASSLVAAPVIAAPVIAAPVIAATAAASDTAAPANGPPRTFTFVNKMHETIWVAAAQSATAPQLATTGWILPVGHKITIRVPNHWNGRFWGRTGCHFDKAGHGHCQTGDCGGVLRCTGGGAIPATLAEYDLDAFDHLDFYDVSMVDGSNLPMYINTLHGRPKDPISANGCSAAGCTTPVVCPPALQVRAGGAVVGCISACARFGTDPYCCRGAWSSRSVCIPRRWPIDYAAVFKRAEPYAYSYVYDDATSTFTCAGICDYRITFGVTPHTGVTARLRGVRRQHP